MASAPANSPQSVVQLGSLPARGVSEFRLVPDREASEAATEILNLLGLRKAHLTGRLTPVGQSDWQLDATLGATVVQPCAVTLDPVTTRIDVPVARRFVADYGAPEGAEVEMPEDDSLEPLTDTLDLMALFLEELALNLPEYPRAPDAELRERFFTEPGKVPLDDDASKPFADLAAFRKSLKGNEE